MQMSLGETAMLHITSDYAYGTRGIGPIPPNADLDFKVELLAINGVRAGSA
jgi:FKBP-type peptidyl-prolyl cis-trans isomerase